MTCKEKMGSCCTVFGIGVLQLLLVACFLIGWIWSCIWGVTFIGMSGNEGKQPSILKEGLIVLRFLTLRLFSW